MKQAIDVNERTFEEEKKDFTLVCRVFEVLCVVILAVFAVGALAVTVIIVGRGLYKGRQCLAWNGVMFLLQGLGGCIIAFLFFFSLHPTVGSNWLLILFNPLPLIYLPWLIGRGIKQQKDPYHVYNAVVLTSFILLMPFLPQEFNLTVLPLALSLLFTSIGHLFIYNRKHQ